MMQSHARIATDKAARYMTQLARHWSHKFEVELEEARARIALPMGTCAMAAAAGGLTVTVAAPAAEELARMETVVADHLARFAFREPELKIEWRRIEGPQA